MTKPFNLATGEYGSDYDNSLTHRQTVIAAHAQEQGDFNTWDYEKVYADIVVEFDTPGGARVVRCGNWTLGAYDNDKRECDLFQPSDDPKLCVCGAKDIAHRPTALFPPEVES